MIQALAFGLVQRAFFDVDATLLCRDVSMKHCINAVPAIKMPYSFQTKPDHQISFCHTAPSLFWTQQIVAKTLHAITSKVNHDIQPDCRSSSAEMGIAPPFSTSHTIFLIIYRWTYFLSTRRSSLRQTWQMDTFSLRCWVCTLPRLCSLFSGWPWW